jgi:hypothetical protein
MARYDIIWRYRESNTGTVATAIVRDQEIDLDEFIYGIRSSLSTLIAVQDESATLLIPGQNLVDVTIKDADTSV